MNVLQENLKRLNLQPSAALDKAGLTLVDSLTNEEVSTNLIDKQWTVWVKKSFTGLFYPSLDAVAFSKNGYCP